MTTTEAGPLSFASDAEALAWYRATYDDDETSDQLVLARLEALGEGRSFGPDAHGVPRRQPRPAAPDEEARETATAEAAGRRAVIRNRPNNCLTRFPCALCGGHTGKQEYLFQIAEDIGITGQAPANPLAGLFGRTGDVIVCDECAQNPGQIPAMLRDHAGRLRERADALAAAAELEYVTEVIPVPEDLREIQGGMYSETGWPDWMRERIGLPVLTDAERRALWAGLPS